VATCAPWRRGFERYPATARPNQANALSMVSISQAEGCKSHRAAIRTAARGIFGSFQILHRGLRPQDSAFLAGRDDRVKKQVELSPPGLLLEHSSGGLPLRFYGRAQRRCAWRTPTLPPCPLAVRAVGACERPHKSIVKNDCSMALSSTGSALRDVRAIGSESPDERLQDSGGHGAESLAPSPDWIHVTLLSDTRPIPFPRSCPSRREPILAPILVAGSEALLNCKRITW